VAAPPPAVASPRRLDRSVWLIALGLFAVAFLLAALTAGSYGPTYDEPHYASAGIQYAQWWGRVLRFDLSALSRDQIEAAWHFNHEHPPLLKVATGFAQLLFGGASSGLTAMRLPAAKCFAFAVAAVFLFLVPVWGRAGALFAAAALMLMPRFFAHAHFAALDMPIAAWFFITAALAAVAAERNSWPWAVAAGAAFGIALAAKVNAFFLPILLIPWVLIWHRKSWPKVAVALALIGPAVFFLSWPWLWIAPVSHLRDYLAFHFGHAAYNVWYLGRLYQYAPWHYPFVMLAVTTPVLVLLLALGGLVRTAPRRKWEARPALLFLGLAIAILPSALPGSPKYNGVRLFLPALPFLAATAGGGFAWVAERLKGALVNRPDGAKMAALATVALGALVLLPGARAIARLDPYELAYYNELVGGPRGAARRSISDAIYWGQVLADAPAFLNSINRPSPTVLVIPKGVIYLLEFQQQSGALKPDVHFTGDEAEAGRADYVLFQMMQSEMSPLAWELAKHAEPAYSFTVDGTPLLVAFDPASVSAALARLKEKSAAPAPSTNASATSDTNSPAR
jgi:4-amino-4-deoxy-L-arabinose transferase-like glycosyltransferase